MYVTLTQVKDYLLQFSETQDDGLILVALKAAHEAIDEYCGWDFEPYRETLYHNFNPARRDVGAFSGYYPSNQQVSRDPRQLRLIEPLLELESVTNGDGTALDTDDLKLLSANHYPKYALQFTKASGLNWVADDDDDNEQVIPVTGLWGFHEKYARDAWVNSLDTVQDNPLLIGATTLTVTDVDGIAGDSETPRLQAGLLLKLTDGTDYEFVYVVSTNTTLNTALITRGYRGTVAKEWPQATPIYIYRAPYGVRQAVMEITRLVYRRKDQDSGNTKQIMMNGVKIIPETIPAYVLDFLPAPRSFL